MNWQRPEEMGKQTEHKLTEAWTKLSHPGCKQAFNSPERVEVFKT